MKKKIGIIFDQIIVKHIDQRIKSVSKLVESNYTTFPVLSSKLKSFIYNNWIRNTYLKEKKLWIESDEFLCCILKW